MSIEPPPSTTLAVILDLIANADPNDQDKLSEYWAIAKQLGASDALILQATGRGLGRHLTRIGRHPMDYPEPPPEVNTPVGLALDRLKNMDMLADSQETINALYAAFELGATRDQVADATGTMPPVILEED